MEAALIIFFIYFFLYSSSLSLPRQLRVDSQKFYLGSVLNKPSMDNNEQRKINLLHLIKEKLLCWQKSCVVLGIQKLQNISIYSSIPKSCQHLVTSECTHKNSIFELQSK